MAADPAAGLRLGHKLLLAVVALTALLALLLLLFVGPATNTGFLRAGEALVQRSITAMRALATDGAQQSRDVLVSLIGHTDDARRRALADLPLQLYADHEQLRAAVQVEDGKRSERLRRNVAVLAAETGRRTDAHIEAVLADLGREQQALAAGFAAQVRTAHLLLAGAVLAAAMGLLGLGLWRFVVRPVAALRAATQRVAGGDLATDVAATTGDEIGALAADFSVMLRQLRQSRQQLAELNAGLERQVEQKTRELAQAEKMASIGTLAGGIAHEFNNLIGGIRGCAAEARASETAPDRQETLDVILRATDRGAAIVAQLRRFAKQEQRRDSDLDLANVVHDALRLCEPEARRRGVVVLRDLPSGLRVRGDDDALHQVFVNLLTNALQAMPQGGKLTVAGRRDGGENVVRVADTGTGIAAADLPRIFEPFFSRRSDEPDPAQRGTGLGLSVSYGIVDAHGGSIRVDSTVGEGTTFQVRLPALA